jgi:hypothetical protein
LRFAILLRNLKPRNCRLKLRKSGLCIENLTHDFLPLFSFSLDAGIGLWLRGDGNGNFESVNVRESGIEAYGQQRGLALCDYDGDGRVDFAIGQNSAETRLFHTGRESPGRG